MACTQAHPRARILVADDDLDILKLFSSYFEHHELAVDTCTTLGQFRDMVRSSRYDAVLVDVYLGPDDGRDALLFVLEHSPTTHVFMMTGQESVPLAVDVMERGAATFLSKSRGIKEIATELFRILPPRSEDGPVPTAEGAAELAGLVGASRAMQRLRSQIELFSQVDATVLIQGETGTGKELVAQALHQRSPRCRQPFEAVNCAAIPENLLEAELFGYVRGAFTDAKADRDGLFVRCQEGTVFLDEIGDLPLALQGKLLRVLQEREVRPLGSHQVIPIRTRVLAATHRGLPKEVQEGRFRQDLFYRLSVLQLKLPPLRDRREDVPVLARHFLRVYCERFGRRIESISNEVIARLTAMPWEGNVRELANTMERAVILATDGEIRLEHLFTDEEREEEAVSGLGVLPLSHSEAKRRFESEYLRNLMAAAGGNISQAAQLAGKHRTEIYRLIDRCGNQPPPRRAAQSGH